MDTGSGRSVSPWMATPLPPLEPLERDLHADVCVVGAGIAGVTTAYLLAAEQKSVVVLDDGGIASGETARTTAHLVTALDDRYFHLEKLHGEAAARTAYRSHAAAIDRVERIVGDERIDCGFERLDGWLFAPPGEKTDVIGRELEAARRAGVAGVERALRAPIAGFDTGPALRFPRQAQIHPLRYLAVVATAAQRAGVRFHRAHAAEISGGKDAHVLTSDGRRVTAGALVVATNTPVNDRFEIHTKQAGWRSYVVAMRVRRGSVPRALYWDAADSYHYVRLEPMPGDEAARAGPDELLIVGGEDHRTGLVSDGANVGADDAEARFERLIAWTRARFPARDVLYRWSGQVFEPVDSLALIGRNPRDEHNVFIATGDSGNGMTHGTIAGILLTDLIVGRKNEWEALYDPSRKTLKAAGTWVKENAAGISGFTNWVTPGDVKSEAEIRVGDAAVLRRGASKVAAYRDPSGNLHEVSAACTHLGAVLCWNTLEKTWDCPAHGSRFDADGRVVCGPANRDLSLPDESKAAPGATNAAAETRAAEADAAASAAVAANARTAEAKAATRSRRAASRPPTPQA